MASAPTSCAYCRQQPATPAFTPFCSDRCKMADLGLWLTGAYRVPVATPDPDDTLGDDALLYELHDEEDTLR